MRNFNWRNKKFLVCLTLVLAMLTIANVTNPPNGYTGAPGDDLCSECHTGNPPLLGLVQIHGLPEVINPNLTYIVMLEIVILSGEAESAGFQVVALDESDENVGDFSNASASSTLTFSGGREYWEHNPAKLFGAGTSVMWQAHWKPPSGMAGETISFYASGLFANGDDADTGDETVTRVRTYTMEGVSVELDVNLFEKGDVSCFGFNDGFLSVQAFGGKTPYSYEWSNGGNTSLITNLVAGDYGLTVTDNVGDMVDTVFTIVQPEELVLEVFDIESPLCFGDENGSALVEVSGGTPELIIEWSDGEVGAINESLAGGFNRVVVTDANGCTAEESFTLPEPDELIGLLVSSQDVICTGLENGKAVLAGVGGTEPYTFDWGGGRLGPVQNDLPAGEYEVTLSDINECSTTISLTIGEPERLQIELVKQVNNICGQEAAGSLEINFIHGQGEVSILWSNGDMGLLTENLENGFYSVTLTDEKECTATEDYIIFGSMPMNLDLTGSTETGVGEMDGMINLEVTGGSSPYGYIWSNGETTQDLDNLSPGNYIVTVSDNFGCEAIDSIFLNEFGCELAIEIIVQEGIFCPGDESGILCAVVTGHSGQLTYEWSDGTLDSCARSLGAGEYSVTVTDEDGCHADLSGILTEPEPIILDLADSTITGPGEMDGVIDLEVSGGSPPYEYIWSNGETTQDLDSLSPGNYVVTVTDSLGCEIIDSIFMNVFGCELAVEIVASEVIRCSGDSSGIFCALVSGNVGQVTFEWSDGTLDSCARGLGAGEYSVTVVDEDGCHAQASGILTEPEPLGISTNVLDNVCFDDLNGQIEVVVTGGVGPYVVLPDTLIGLPNGNYPIFVTDSNGCSDVVIATIISSSDSMYIDVDEVINEQSGVSDGEIQITHNGGEAPFVFEWTDSLGMVISNEEDLIGVSTGEYTLTVTDSLGCEITTTVFVDVVTAIIEQTKGSFKVFPNPVFDGQLYLEMEADIEQLQAKIYSIKGSLISESRLVFAEGTTSLTFDLEPGIYILNLSNNEFNAVRTFIVGG